MDIRDGFFDTGSFLMCRGRLMGMVGRLMGVLRRLE